MYYHYGWKFRGLQLVPCSEVVVISEGPLSEVPLSKTSHQVGVASGCG